MKKAENQNTCNLELSKTGRATNYSLMLIMNDLQKESGFKKIASQN
jgi:hypothetical protein